MTSKEAYQEIIDFKKWCNAEGIIPEKKYMEILLDNYRQCLEKEGKKLNK